MSTLPSRAPRLYIEAPLARDIAHDLTAPQANYLGNVLRLAAGDRVLLFNGRDGEWLAEIAARSKRAITVRAREQLRVQEDGPDLVYLFAPLKHARLDYMVQKATELGVARLCPVLTEHTQVQRVNLERMRANAIEAAEQCGVLRVPTVSEPQRLTDSLRLVDAEGRRLIVCDEAAPVADPIAALADLPPGPLAVLVGPEGGFSPSERQTLRSLPASRAIRLGPRIMRADTAAVAVLALVNAVLGDWR
jgi:16S rRNA (uracil1498-N3)-methyltransferase